MRDDELPADPELIDIPEPLLGGTEPITRSDDPQGDRT